MQRINYKSDLKIVESFPAVENFIYHFATDGESCYDVSLEIGNCLKGVDEEGKDVLIICLDSHGLHEGQLKVRRELLYKDDDFPDKIFNKVVETKYDIYLVDGISDEVDPVEVEGYIPIFRGWSAYEVAVQHGFVGTEEEWLKSLKGEKGDKGDDGVVTEEQLQEVETKVLNAIQPILDTKQPTLISGTNIKTINGDSILGSGDLVIKSGDGKVKDVKVNNTSVLDADGIANVDLSTYATTNALTNVGNLAFNALNTATEALATANEKLSPDLSNINEDGKNVIKHNTGIFVAQFNKTPFEEVSAAINEGKKILVENLPNGSYFTNVEVAYVGSNYVQFFGFRTSLSASLNGYVSISLSGNNWNIQKTGDFEDSGNKKSTITNSTTYYPNNKAVIDYVAPIKDKVELIELFKFPNLTIFGTPTIQSGQISNFSNTNYAQFPFLVDFRGQSFEINMCFTTGNDVTSQHNIFDSNFGLAFAIRNGKFVFAGSSDGSTWDMGEHIGSYAVQVNSTYYVKFSWNGSTYKLEVSTDKDNYITDITYDSSSSLYPKQIIIGKAILGSNTFVGSINLNYCNLLINGKEVWQGMDDAGLASRLATDLSNIDAAGEAKIKDIVSTREWYGTQAEFDALAEYQVDVNYYIYDTNTPVTTNYMLNDMAVYSPEDFDSGIAVMETFDYPLDEETEVQDDKEIS